ncbi:hypothetical protein [Tropicimonas sediminicola]|uniref:Uncharacterized protein n=1 Tax=Tropicimonas sediminicola TaxID=1031541 RepID=A0A239H599_9RHOB|nr:hypothetical protein [Tropicimonas sediminicola]SNS76599.1 hypothetical protein SAMN05421757_103258 [Tropicimonas sediminicola]
MRIALPLAAITVALSAGAIAADTMAATKRARSGDFDATDEVRCAQEVGQALGTCGASVARVDGSAAVTVTFPNGFARMLTFSEGAFLRGSATMSGVGTDIDWSLSDGVYTIRVDDQRFDIPDALVIGD